jgi:hypothetical protein
MKTKTVQAHFEWLDDSDEWRTVNIVGIPFNTWEEAIQIAENQFDHMHGTSAQQDTVYLELQHE